MLISKGLFKKNNSELQYNNKTKKNKYKQCSNFTFITVPPKINLKVYFSPEANVFKSSSSAHMLPNPKTSQRFPFAGFIKYIYRHRYTELASFNGRYRSAKCFQVSARTALSKCCCFSLTTSDVSKFW